MFSNFLKFNFLTTPKFPCNQFEYKATKKTVNEGCVFKVNINFAWDDDKQIQVNKCEEGLIKEHEYSNHNKNEV